MPAKGVAEKRQCEPRSNPPIVNREVTFVEANWDYEGRWHYSFPGHLHSPALWEEFAVGSKILNLTTQPTDSGEYYSGIPTTDWYWNLINISDKDLYVEACIEYRWEDNGITINYSCSKQVVAPQSGIELYGGGESPTKYHMGIWFIGVEEAIQNGIPVRDVCC